MIEKKRVRILRKTTSKVKKYDTVAKKPPRKSKYSKKYLENRDKIRRLTIEKANAEFFLELSHFNELSDHPDTRMIIEEDPPVEIKKNITFHEQPSYIILKNERVSARNQRAPPLQLPTNSNKTAILKPILRKFTKN